MEFGKGSRKGAIVFKGKQFKFKVVEAVDGRFLTSVGKLFEQFEVVSRKKGLIKYLAERNSTNKIGLIDIGWGQ